MSHPILKTYVYCEDKVFFVSTIEREYDTYEGTFGGEETIAWEMDGETLGKQVYQGGGLQPHFDVCRRLAVDGLTDPYDD